MDTRTFYLLFASLLGTLVLGSATVNGATIYVPGDQPTIQAGIDAAADGDLIIVAPGVYAGPGNTNLLLNDKSVLLVSGAGPNATTIDCGGISRAILVESSLTDDALIEGFTIRNGSEYQGGAIRLQFASPTIRRCVFSDNVAEGGGAIYGHSSSPTIEECLFDHNSGNGGALALVVDSSPEILGCLFLENSGGAGGAVYNGARSSPTLEACIFEGNSATSGGAVYSQSSSDPQLINCTLHANGAIDATIRTRTYGGSPGAVTLQNTIIAFGTQGTAVHCDPTSAATLTCCDVYGNAAGDWVDCIADQYGINGNISGDPLFCDAGAGDLTLNSASPCAPANSGSCELIGALNVGCGPVAVEPTTWGAIKASYR